MNATRNPALAAEEPMLVMLLIDILVNWPVELLRPCPQIKPVVLLVLAPNGA